MTRRLLAALVLLLAACSSPEPRVWQLPDHMSTLASHHLAESAARAGEVEEKRRLARYSPRPTPPVARSRAVVRVPAGDVWDRLADCESGSRDRHGRVIPGSARWSLNSSNGYFGGLQFSLESWRWVGGSGYPHEHSREEQIARAKVLQRRIGWRRGWPSCSRRLGL